MHALKHPKKLNQRLSRLKQIQRHLKDNLNYMPKFKIKPSLKKTVNIKNLYPLLILLKIKTNSRRRTLKKFRAKDRSSLPKVYQDRLVLQDHKVQTNQLWYNRP